MNALRIILEGKSKNKEEDKTKNRNLKKNFYEHKVNNKFYEGLNSDEINNLEKLFGFVFPSIYRGMLSNFSGFYRETISVDPSGNEEIIKTNRLYNYPNDSKETQWLVDEVKEFMDEVKSVIKDNGFDESEIEGFIPIYSHRVLVVFKDKRLSPVISIYDGDIIIYGKNLKDYLINEFGIKR
ncbi:hypothetical protein IUY40_04500 [Flavobacterium sp. ALJ2]|uniref:hypothetical protein n=1 Tax=Flavobacterium sp. ALJ2 TaxID=2786960 RepID=UPI00189CCA3C|nr:hypothetical protein [Flavobacterium sp. ALJ2]MBF7090797.1 hypothetical protein [Flavobacterium sp. ALJ2]